MAFDIAALATATAKLIGLGVGALTAREHAGWGTDEAKLFGDALGSIPAFYAVAKGNADDKHSSLQAYCELLTGAFGDAWRRHWANNEHLAPAAPKSRVHAWFASTPEKERTEQLARALKSGRWEKVLATATPLAEVALLDSLADPIASPWFRALLAAFMTEEDASEDVDSSSPPLLQWQKGQEGASRREFERDVRSAFFEGLVSDKYRALAAWLQTRPEEQARLVRIMLAVRLSSFRTEHIFGTYDAGSPFPRLPLEDIYVEPAARRLKCKHGELRESEGESPALVLLSELLAQPTAQIIVVLADFGRGKSLTARSLAWRLADRFLDEAQRSSPELAYPIFVRCSAETIKRTALKPESIVRSATKRQAEALLPATVEHTAFGLPQQQATIVLLDGLDEVQLEPEETRELFASLRDSSNANLRFLVFSRPAAIPPKVREDASIRFIALQDFSSHSPAAESAPAEDGNPPQSHVAVWLDRWSKLADPPHPELAALEKHGLLELCRTPVLLFMVAQTWKELGQQTDVKRADVYDAFIALTARSRLQQEASAHPVVAEAAKILHEKLRGSGALSRETNAEDAMVELLSRIAWRAHFMQQDDPGASFTTHDVKTVLREKELDIRDKTLTLVTQGVLLALSTALGGDDPEVHFTHKSFREFLVAKYWEARLRRLTSDPRPTPDTAAQLRTELMAGRLFAVGDESAAFLLELCKRWPSEERARLSVWARQEFNDETLSSITSLRADQRYIMREVALMLGSRMSDTGLEAANPFSLATLCAVSELRGPHTFIFARGLSHVEARLEGANLEGANLEGANLRGANLRGANLRGANLRGANLQLATLQDTDFLHSDLQGANLQRAMLLDTDLRSAKLRGANLQQALLAHARLIGANLQGANLQRAHLVSADLLHANLQGANLQGASLEGANLGRANLEGANLQGAFCNDDTRFPENIPQAILADMLRIPANVEQDGS